MRAAVYTRISRDKRKGTDDEGLGVERQLELSTAMAQARGWDVVEAFSDNDMSATKKRRRPGYEALLKAIENGQIQAVVAYRLDRLLRRVADVEHLASLCQRHGVPIALVRDAHLDLSTPGGQLMATVLGALARHEVQVKSERQRDEAQQRASRGAPGGGRRAFGYGSDGLTVVEAEAAAVRAAYDQLIAGKALSAIATKLNEGGFTTTMGGPWRHNALRSMITNPRYIAKRAYKGVVVADATWAAIIDDEVWTEAQQILAGPDRRTNHVGSERKWLGSGLFICGQDGCGMAMRATYREKYDDGRAKRVYRCSGCYSSRLAEPVDDVVDQVMRNRLGRSDLAALLADPADRDAQLSHAAELRTRRRSLAKLLVDGVLTEDEVRDEAARLDALIHAAAGTGRSDRSALAALVNAPNPVAVWDAASPQGRADIIEILATVVLLKVPSGRRAFEPESVAFTWK